MSEEGLSPGSYIRVREYTYEESVGIDSAPHQLVKKLAHNFKFNMLLIGETGIGKSTLASSLFNIPHNNPSTHKHSEVTLKSHTYDLHERGVDLKLTITETVGYGDQINRKDSIRPILKYIEDQFEEYFQEELKISKTLSTYNDTRVHVCLYFICPSGHSLKSIDLYCMKELHDKVNLIPVVARADSLSTEDLQLFKSEIKRAIQIHGINIYNFPTDDQEISEFNFKSNELVPFAVAASRDYVSVNDKLSRARVFPWGTMLVENEEHSEFLSLKRALIETNMVDLVENACKYYETYRSMRLTELGGTESASENFQELIQNLQKKHRQEMFEQEQQLQRKFTEKAFAKEAELKNLEKALHSKYKKIFNELEKEEKNIECLNNRLLNYKKKIAK